MPRPKKRQGTTYLLLGVTVFLVLAGLLMIYSASSVADYVRYSDSAYHLKKQLLFIAVGALSLFLASRLDLRFAAKSSGLLRDPRILGWVVWGVSFVGLLAVLAFGIGKWGAQRWVIVAGIPLQPSELAKLGCVLMTVLYLSMWQRRQINGRELFGRLMVVLLPIVVLIMLQPDMGTTMSIVFAVFLILWLGDVNGPLLGAIAVSGTALAALMVWVESYRLARYLAFLDPWKDPLGDGFQIIQSLYSFGSGGIVGVGLGLSKQKFFYLPAAHTDFIFAILGEELGLVGALVIVLAFAVFAFAGIRIALDAGSVYDRLLAGGLTAMIVTQAVMNMAAVTGLMPITGIPLPLMSYGGSSMIFTLACVGLVVGVARRSHGVRARVRVRSDGSAAETATDSTARGSQRAVSLERRRDGGPHLSGLDGGRPPRRKRA
jgi:cell division protein FtsW